MEIREIKQRNLKLLEESIQTTKRGIQLVKNSLDPFGNEQEDYGSEGEKGIDPTKFMSKKEVKEWNRLSAHRQAKFIKRGLKEASLHQSQQKVEENVRKVFREELIQQELTGIKRNSHIYAKSKNSFKTKESGKERTEQIRGNQGGSHRTTGAETREVSCEKGGFHTQSGETVQAMSGKSFSETQAASSTGGGSERNICSFRRRSGENSREKQWSRTCNYCWKKSSRKVSRIINCKGNGGTTGTTEIAGIGSIWQSS